MRQVVLDTETTGLEPEAGHRIIEIGAIELVDRRMTGRRFQRFVNPEREIDAAALEVHNITLAELQNKPRFNEVADDLLAFLEGAELIIHNAAFDVAFLNAELSRAGRQGVAQFCPLITDSLSLARARHPGQKNNLDALCRRYGIDDSKRDFHGAELDASLLAQVYLAMTGGQTSLLLEDSGGAEIVIMSLDVRRLPSDRQRLPVIAANDDEIGLHEAQLKRLKDAVRG